MLKFAFSLLSVCSILLMMLSWIFGKKKADTEADEYIGDSDLESETGEEHRKKRSQQQVEKESSDESDNENCDCYERSRCCNKGRVSTHVHVCIMSHACKFLLPSR